MSEEPAASAASAAPEHAVSLGPRGWLPVLGQAAGITFSLALKAGKSLLASKRDGALSFHEYIVYQGMREYQCGLGAVPVQNLLPSTSKTCARFARRHAVPLETLQLPDATTVLRLGPPKAQKSIAYFHGGGYMAPALSEHVPMALGYGRYGTENVNVFVLQYDLASEDANHYPRQLQQAVSLLNYLVTSENMSPTAITLLGDSAGAHLLLSLLLHVDHPKPGVSPLKIDAPFSGAVMISPWVAPKPSSTSAQDSDQVDVLTEASLAYWAKNFLGDADLDPWNNPLTAPEDWWSSLPVGKILVTYGGKELLRDDAETLCKILQENHTGATALRFPDEIHVHMVMNRFLRLNKRCESQEAYMKWLDDHVGS